jgi:hypothetical protein
VDHGGGFVADTPTRILEPPHEVDIFAESQIGVEAVDGAERVGSTDEGCCGEV